MKKVFKRFVGICLMVTLVLGTTTSFFANGNMREAPVRLSSEVSNEVFNRNQEKSFIILDRFWSSLTQNERGQFIYPDSFGGVYIDSSGNSVILKTKDISKYFTESEVNIRTVEFSYNEIQNLYNRICDYFFSLKENEKNLVADNLNYACIDVKRNRVNIRLYDSSPEQIELFKKTVVDHPALDFEYLKLVPYEDYATFSLNMREIIDSDTNISNISIDNDTENDKFVNSTIETYSPLRFGQRIYSTNDPINPSMGCLGFRARTKYDPYNPNEPIVYGFVTVNHLQPGGGVLASSLPLIGPPLNIGYIYRSAPFIDSVFVNATCSVDSITFNGDSTIPISRPPVENQGVMKIAENGTYYYNSGMIISVDILKSVTFPSSTTWVTVTYTSAIVELGDSGGFVTSTDLSSGCYPVMGIVVCKDTPGNTPGNMSFANVNHILAYLSLELY